uniref:Alpha-mannosidase n=1 Tax=Acrobeloides nanus TaxID=290746 RepID=A0A914E6I4_9BILA
MQIETLERAVALSQHHDAVTGTSKEFVTQDYIYHMTQGWTEVEQVLNNAMQTISQSIKNNSNPFPYQIICRNINESECAFTRTNNLYTVTVHNGNAQSLNTLVKVPLYQNSNSITVTDSNGNLIDSQVTYVFENPSQLNNTNIANYEISFMASVQPLGFKTYFISINTINLSMNKQGDKLINMPLTNNDEIKSLTNSISNGLIQLDFDSKGYLTISTIALDPMDIKTYKLTVQPAGYGNQTGLYSSTVHPTSATATTIAASSTQTTPSGGTCSWNNCPTWSNNASIWNIHFIPHTHDDLGWLKPVDEYYSTGQLEIIGGGWVQPDEAASHYVELIDQYTLGDNNVFTVTIHNGYAQYLNTLVRIPLYQNTENVAVTDVNGNSVTYQIVNVFSNPGQLNNSNISPYEIGFMARVSPLGFRTYFVEITLPTNYIRSKRDENEVNLKTKIMEEDQENLYIPTRSISNENIQLDFDDQGLLSTFHDLTSGLNYSLKQEFLYYHGYNGSNGPNSNAYIFRPNPIDKAFSYPNPISLKIINGSIINEARQIVSPWVSQTIRLIPGKTFVEFEWTIGPIPYE